MQRKSSFARFLRAGIAGALIATITPSFAADNPRDPNFMNAATKLRDQYFDMLKMMDKDMDGMINSAEWLHARDPRHPQFNHTTKEWDEMMATMDTNKDGMISLAEYMAAASPLHPGHKFYSKN